LDVVGAVVGGGLNGEVGPEVAAAVGASPPPFLIRRK
jgi:hypothetical protein